MSDKAQRSLDELRRSWRMDAIFRRRRRRYFMTLGAFVLIVIGVVAVVAAF